jgi:hypothetical protein
MNLQRQQQLACLIKFQTGGSGAYSNTPRIYFRHEPRARCLHTYESSHDEIGCECEKEGPMTRKLLMTVTIIAIALTPSIGIGTAHAHGFGGGGFHGGGFGGRGFHGGGFGGRGFDRRGFFNEVFFGGYGGFYPGYYGYGSAPYCYYTVYGTTACY